MELERRFILRIVSSNEGRRGEEYPVPGTGVIIGRSSDCDITLSGDHSVSRRHARVERAANQIKVSDLGSANGVWVDETRVSERVLGPGERFRIGSTEFECDAGAGATREPPSPTGTVFLPEVPPPVESRTVFGGAKAFVVRIVETDEPERTGEEVVVQTRWATLGRGEDCTIRLEGEHISRQHAKIDLVPAGFRVTDLGSTNGTWVDSRRIEKSEVLPSGQRFRLGDVTVLECHLQEEEEVSPQPAVERTVIESIPAEVVSEEHRIEDEGEAVELSANKPFVLDDPEFVWIVVSGEVDIFTATLEKGKAVGTRDHFLGILPRQAFFGFDLRTFSSGFLAIGNQGAQVRKIPLARLRELASQPANAESVASLIDTWLVGVAKSLRRGVEVGASIEPALRAGEEVIVGAGRRVSSAQGVVWIEVWRGSVLFSDLTVPSINGSRGLLPVAPDSWIESLGDELGDLPLTPSGTVDAMKQPGFWESLLDFHKTLCECEFLQKGLRNAEEYLLLQERRRVSEEARRAGRAAMLGAMSVEGGRPSEFLETGSAEPVLRACELVGRALGMIVKNHPEVTEGSTYEEKVSAIARASGFRTRVVALRGEWWKQDHGPVLGQLEEGKAPVAILPTGPGAYECIDPTEGTRVTIDAKVASAVSGFGHAFYRPFPERRLAVMDVMRFGIRGLMKDFRLLIIMGLTIGLFGTLAPYLTGRIFDSAIPQADKALLLGFGVALLTSALASAVFRLTQGIATLRVQGKMEFTIQAALWDRLLNLPTNFFRRFSAGDLADRAAGVDAIQNLISGAGVAAILGSFSGIFYVFQMFLYDQRLTIAAILLTAFFVGFTTIANYLQLRHQRVEMQLRGRITGLVLNLISGVSKLRVAGAENQAFSVWAQRFSRQKKIGFSIGRIQNIVTVFNSVFPVLSSMIVFLILVNAQKSAAESGGQPLSTGDFIAFTAAYGLFLTAMQALGDASLNMLRVVPIYERLAPIVTTSPEVDSTKSFPGKLRGGIELSHVFFRYNEDAPYIINDLCLKIEPGEFVAFVGGSGCGKSTLLRLLLGFEQPEKGAVLYDGQDLSTIDLRMLREQLGVVLQVSKVLPAEIYRNIIGVSSRTIEDAWDAAEKAGLADDIRNMPMKMHTYVSEGGGTLSGGQRQRLMIARAIVNKPKVIFLDEATSALDNRSQAVVTESMDRMDATRIVIAHRLSTIINADKICYLEGGKVAEMGAYQELMAKDGLFAQLAKRQMA